MYAHKGFKDVQVNDGVETVRDDDGTFTIYL